MPGWNFPEVVGLFTYPQEVFAFTITRVQLPLLVYQTGSCLWPPSCTLLFFLIPPSASLPWTGPWPSQPGHAHSLGPFHGPRSKPPPPAPPSSLMDLHITEEGPLTTPATRVVCMQPAAQKKAGTLCSGSSANSQVLKRHVHLFWDLATHLVPSPGLPCPMGPGVGSAPTAQSTLHLFPRFSSSSWSAQALFL